MGAGTGLPRPLALEDTEGNETCQHQSLRGLPGQERHGGETGTQSYQAEVTKCKWEEEMPQSMERLGREDGRGEDGDMAVARQMGWWGGGAGQGGGKGWTRTGTKSLLRRESQVKNSNLHAGLGFRESAHTWCCEGRVEIATGQPGRSHRLEQSRGAPTAQSEEGSK